MRQKEQQILLEAIEGYTETAKEAVHYVGQANYNDREAEAISNVNKADAKLTRLVKSMWKKKRR